MAYLAVTIQQGKLDLEKEKKREQRRDNDFEGVYIVRLLGPGPDGFQDRL